MVDSNDRGNIAEAIEEIQNKLNMDAFENIPVLVFANKQDLQEAMSADDLLSRKAAIECDAQSDCKFKFEVWTILKAMTSFSFSGIFRHVQLSPARDLMKACSGCAKSLIKYENIFEWVEAIWIDLTNFSFKFYV